jgi:hypothetical protein
LKTLRSLRSLRLEAIEVTEITVVTEVINVVQVTEAIGIIDVFDLIHCGWDGELVHTMGATICPKLILIAELVYFSFIRMSTPAAGSTGSPGDSQNVPPGRL